jgi:fucose 4-O-acetylase-like acetyltransferase
VAVLDLPTSPIYTLDFAFALPVLAFAGIRFLRGDPRGPGMALALLVFSVLMGPEVLAIFLFEVQASVAVDALITGVFAAVVVIGTGLNAVALSCNGSPPGGAGMRRSW